MEFLANIRSYELVDLNILQRMKPTEGKIKYLLKIYFGTLIV